MKIILTAFNGMLESLPLDMPEETGRIFHLRLMQPERAIHNFDGDVTYKYPPFGTTCEFIKTNMYRSLNNEKGLSAAIYELNEIRKE